jgi:peptidoglycan DL-endopeptidase CwlO
MTPRARRAARHAIAALIVLALIVATSAVAAPASAAADLRPRHPAKKHRIAPGLRAVQIANHLTGVPYRWGGTSPRSGFDCSGFVMYVYGKLGIQLPHNAASQFGHGRRVMGALQAGDLVFFSGLGHVGIYAGGGKFIHAPQSGTTVRWSRLSSHGSYYGATRVVAA